MTTDIGVTRTESQVEKRSWYLGTADQPGHTESVTLDVSAFTAGTHYPNGYIPSGTVLATVAGLAVPYDSTNAGAAGTPGVATGILFSSVKVPADGHDVGGAALQAFAAVRTARLPFQAGTGSLDVNARTDLQNLHFV